MNTGKLTYPFRQLGLMHLLDKAKYYFHYFKNRKFNRRFKAEFPNVVLPPDYLMYESYRLNYRKYFLGGRDNALWLKEHFEKHTNLQNKNILDWGCGPARVIRHLPEVFTENCNFFGTDYNSQTIKWCSENIQTAKFAHNGINPPLHFENDFFDLIYGISIFTHLSEKNHKDWFDELIRVSKKGAILLLTSQGNAFKEKLTSTERNRFEQGVLITRGKVKEGHRVYSAFHPPAYIKKLFGSQVEILEHIPGEKKHWGIGQDAWIIKKN